MAEVARIGLSLGGAALFGPIGGVAGGVLGNLLFPPESQSIEGPRAETTVTSSAHGQPMAMVLGTKRVAGQLWDADDIREVKKEEGGGKGGGGPSVTTYEYFGTFMMFIAEVPEKGMTYKVRRVWRNKKLVYDRSADPGDAETPTDTNDTLTNDQTFINAAARSDVFENYVTFHPGGADQEPDPTLEALHGVGNVPAYRGMAYMVAKDMPLADTGNQIGSYEFEVVLQGGDDALAQEIVEGKRLFPWLFGPDPRNDQNENVIEVRRTYPDGEPLVENSAVDGEYTGTPGTVDNLALFGWSLTPDANAYRVDRPDDDVRILYLQYNFPLITFDALNLRGRDDVVNYDQPGDGPTGASGWLVDNGLVGTVAYVDDVGPGSAETGEFPGYVVVTNNDASNDPVNPFPGVFLGPTNNAGPGRRVFVLPNSIVAVIRKPDYASTSCEPPWRVIPEAPEWCINVETGDFRPNLNFEIEQTPGEFLKLQVASWSTPATYSQVSLPPTLRVSDARNNEEFWVEQAEAAGDDFVFDIEDYDFTWPAELNEASVAQYDLGAVLAQPITLAEALRLIHKRAGITSSQIDTTAFGDKALWGITIQGGTARSYVEALRTWGWFDWVESDGQLKGVPRGGEPVMTVDADDLGAAEGNPGPELSHERTEDLELPERVRIRYPSLNAAYQSGQQYSERLVTESRNVLDVDMAVADTDGHAAEVAGVVANEQWRARMGRELSLPRQYDRLEPADVFTVSLGGVNYRLRVEEKTYRGAVQLRVVDDEAAEYTSEALAGTVLGGGTLGPLAGPTDIQVLDLPALDDSHDNAGYYIAAWGYTSSWAGAVVQRSSDGGETFTNLVTITDRATVGEVVNPPAAAISTIIDQGGFIDVDMIAGELADTNELAFLNGTANVAAIGAAGRWNIVSFRDVEELDVPGDRTRYRLTYLLQGRLGTEHAVGDTQPGDRLVLLNTALARVTGSVSAVGVSQIMRGATLGTPAANADSNAITPQGVALKPWAPAHLAGQRDDDGNLLITWTRRTRLGGGWQSHPVYEESVRFEVEVRDAEAGVLANTYVVQVANQFRYTDDQQTTDFGSTQPSVLVRLYQISATVGRGYMAEATL